MTLESVFIDLTLIFIVVGVLSFVAKLLRQPLIPVYIISGVILAPLTGLLTDQNIITSMSQLGIVFLLFVAGLELDFKRLKNVSFVSTFGGTLLVAVLFLVGLGIAKFLNLPTIAAVYMGLVVAFSSTMVVVKLLSDKDELDSLHGKIGLGLLIVQDIFAIIAFIILTSYNDFSVITDIIIRTGLILFGFFLLAKFVFPVLFRFAARSQELLFTVSVMIALSFAMIFGLYVSPEALGIGAFLAGLSLANLPYNIEIISRLGPLKDFFSILFFSALGMILPLNELINVWYVALFFTIFILIAKPFIVYLIIRLFGYVPKVSYLTAIHQSQVSEFGLILVFFGLSSGHVDNSFLTTVVLMAVMTIGLSSYLSQHRELIYSFIKKVLPYSKEKDVTISNLPAKFKKKFVLLIGYDRLGLSILETLKDMKEEVVVIDFNPEVISSLTEQNINCIYGDLGDTDLYRHLDLAQCKLVISTIPDKKSNKMLMRQYKHKNRKGMYFLTSETMDDALDLYKEGADYVIIPRHVSGKHLSLMVEKFKFKQQNVLRQKKLHIHELERRTKNGRR